MEQRQQHFLVVTYPAQGHVNPSLRLAKRLAQTTGGHVTFSTAISAHRLMFPSLAKPDEEVEDGLLTYIPFSNGYDDGFKVDTDGDLDDFLYQFKLVGTRTLDGIVHDLAARGRPVSCIIYTIFLSWAADVARDHGIPSALYWIQPATVFTTYYHYFHGYEELITSHGHDPFFTVDLSGLPHLQIRDLPSLITSTNSDDPYRPILVALKETFDTLDQKENSSKPKVLINSFDALEADAIKAVGDMDLITIGPLLPSLPLDIGKDSEDTASGGDLFEADKKRYMEWLDSKSGRSVVYVSFGSMSVIKKRQLEEILLGLKESGRPYLWVVRKDNRGEGVELEDGENGMVVEWCSQVKVLSHPSVGCFVTHCGWNSTLESLICGVPTIGVPQWTDQGTNAKLTEVWGTGVRSEVNGEGLLDGSELKRCLEVVMGEGGRGVEIRTKAAIWKDKAWEAVREGGSSDRNLKTFVEEIASNN